METHGWLFELCGDEYDLQTLVELFGEAFSIKEIDGNWCLTTQLPYSSEASTDAWAVVGAILAELNASAQVAYGNHQNVRLGAMACWDRPGAPPTQIVGPASARSHAAVRRRRTSRTPPSLLQPRRTTVSDGRSTSSARCRRIGEVCTWCLTLRKTEMEARPDSKLSTGYSQA